MNILKNSLKTSLKNLITAVVLLAAAAPPCQGATLSSGLSGADVDRLVEVIGLSSNTRMLRSAESYKSWPGIKLGFEVAMLSTHEVNSLGDSRGTLSPLTFLPRIYIAKGLFFNLELITNFFPISTATSLATLSIALKWTALTEQDAQFAVAPFASFTKIDGFGGYDGSNVEVGAIFSRDFVRYKPYFGGGLVFARAEIINGYALGRNTGADNSIHLFGGVEIEMPVNITFQADLMNLSFSFSTFVGRKF